MKEYLIKESTLTEIANSIREKTNQQNSLELKEIPKQIEGLALDKDSDICFFDYDGTLVYTYSFDELNELTELPPGPVHEGLIFQEWNWSLEGLKNSTLPMDVGANYITDDGKTRVYLNISAKNLTLPIRIWQSIANGVEIDWGDGSEIETNETEGALRITHTYQEPGQYVLAFNPIDDCELRLNGHEAVNEDAWGFMQDDYYDIYSSSFYKIEFGKNVYRITKHTTNYANALLTITVPKTLTIFENRGLFNARSLGYLVFPRNVDLTAAAYMFSGCNTLKSVSLPESFSQIFTSIFGHCYNLTRCRIPDNSGPGTGTFERSYVLEEITLPDTITEIKNYAFAEDFILKRINFINKDNITKIGNYSFLTCRLLHFDIPPNVTYIGEAAFLCCYLLHNIELPEVLTTLGARAFEQCKGLVSINIPSKITTIPQSLFGDCISLQEIDFSTHTSVPTLTNINSFTNVPTTCKMLVPKALEAEWKSATNWSTFADQIIGV